MNEVIREWQDKAEADFLTASREIGVTDRPNCDAVCFHAQQCIEKLMKAVLISRRELPPRTHDLVRLNEMLSESVPDWSCSLSDLRLLDRAAVDYRYHGESADVEEPRQALAIADVLRKGFVALLL